MNEGLRSSPTYRTWRNSVSINGEAAAAAALSDQHAGTVLLYGSSTAAVSKESLSSTNEKQNLCSQLVLRTWLRPLSGDRPEFYYMANCALNYF